MRCDILTRALPVTVNISGMEYPINWDFRIGIQFNDLLRSSIPEGRKFIDMLSLYYPNIPNDVEKAVDQIKWFYRCGDELDEENEKAPVKRRYHQRKSKDPAFVFSQDAAYIYASFREQYGIDLTQGESLHWWKFMALFESLDEDTKMSRILYYRQASTSGMPKNRRAFINEMKKLYRIRDGGGNMTLAQRNQNWKDYIKERFR